MTCTRSSKTSPWMIVAIAIAIAGCSDAPDERPRFRDGSAESLPPRISEVPAPLSAAHCEIMVDGVGLLDLEGDYLPHVIRCENGGANIEALKAQAIAARSVAYYAIETSGSICDSQGCQVYGCAGEPDAIHYQAAQETAGVYMMHSGTLTYGFYVAGDNGVSPPACVGNPGVGTEHWVTYNEGKAGTSVEQTELGFVFDPNDAGYGQNRGCMSQWGARCLENNNGYGVIDIMRFYYGDDIELVQGQGECVSGTFDTGGDGSTSAPDPDGGFDAGADTSSDPPPPLDDDGPSAETNARTDDASIDGSDEGPSIDGALPDSYGGTALPSAGCACATSPLDRALALLMVPLAFVRRRPRQR